MNSDEGVGEGEKVEADRNRYSMNYGMYNILLESLETYLSNGTLPKSLALII
jgi:hypothetical protein